MTIPRTTGGTLSLHDDNAGSTASLVPQLFLVAQAGSERCAALRVRLSNVDEVCVSRASERSIDVRSNGRRCSVHLGVADSWMSSAHARLVREASGWRVIDLGAKNGTRVNGRLERDTALDDGDLLEMGRTFFVFRAGLTTPADAPQILDSCKAAMYPGLATMLPEFAERLDELARMAASKTSIVIYGPTGSGKEMLARAVHELSRRRGPFVAVNCAGLPESLIESELFGHTRGAFTNATSDREGLLASSAGGTLFLDEIGDLPLSAQSKLLRAVQEQAVRPVGGTAEVRVDLRLVSATHRDLDELVSAGEFREDLLARLGEGFELPPLCERREDLGLIINTLLDRIEDPRARAIALANGALRALLGYAWPRNIRELQKVLERAIALAGSGPIELVHLPPDLQAEPAAAARPSEPSSLSPEELAKRTRLIELLRIHEGNVAAVARDLGTVRSQVQRLMARYGVDRREFVLGARRAPGGAPEE